MPLIGRFPSCATSVVCGRVSPGFEIVELEFRRNLEAGGELGAAFSAVRDGEVVVDLWGGWTGAATGQRWERDTLVPVLSGSKGLLAACIAWLLDRGGLELERPVADYWPEFGRNGKGEIRVEHVLSHTAGVPGLTTPVSVEEARDPVRMAALLAEQAPLAPPGSRLCYHALTIGWICAELVRRVDGRPLGRLLREELADPLGLHAWIGLPELHRDRVAVLEPGSGFSREASPPLPRESNLAWSIYDNPPRFLAGALAANDPVWQAAEVPATNAVASARALARLYACLARGGELDGACLLSPATIELARRPLSSGVDPVLGTPLAFAAGFQLQTELQPFGPAADAFGHPGAGGSVHGAWPGLATGFSYATNTLRQMAGPDPRATALLEALHQAL